MNRARLKMVIIAVILLAPILFPSLARADGPEYTTRQILDMIEANDGPEDIDLSGKDLSGIDLSKEKIAEELEKAQERTLDEMPVWYLKPTGGIDLFRANLEDASLASANLQGAYLGDANLQGANLWSANLQGAHLAFANLQGAYLALANLQGAFLTGANLQGACLARVNLQGAHLAFANLQDAYLADANLQGAFLTGANLQDACLGGANLQGADLAYSHLEGVDFFGAASLEGAYFYNAFLDGARMRREQLGGAIGEEIEGRYDEAKEAYLGLKNNFAEIGRYDDALWAYRKERQMERKVLWANRSYGRWFVSLVIDLASGYGLDPYRVLGSSGLIVALFAWAYWFVGGLGSKEEEMPPRSRHPRDWLRCLNYSLAAFATMVYSSLEPRTSRTQTLSSVEAILGILMLALLMFVIGNRIGGI